MEIAIASAKTLEESVKNIKDWGEKNIEYPQAKTFFCGGVEKIAVEGLKKGHFVSFTNKGEKFLLNYSETTIIQNPIAIRLSDGKIFYIQIKEDTIRLASNHNVAPRIFNENHSISKEEMIILNKAFGL